MPLLTLINEVTSVYKKQSSSNTPIVVHCGNGISKTGIFCTLYYGINFVNTGQGIFKVGHAVDLLRQRRKGMVSTKEGYLFCHTALLYYAQDMLVKRGILTSQTTFSNPLTDLSHKRTPSNDFILSDTSMASLDQLSTLSFSSASPARVKSPSRRA
ncbi:hypothetical protein EB796_014520 [Bugula neritina]|uniref:Uncharacterized protein n=1 Tax=Bugula neritina TaxID=10212 RepID=A0A7J7JNG7_BUGNE|nr:hypothetical protein EB796_014520 [Bugula neritina]